MHVADRERCVRPRRHAMRALLTAAALLLCLLRGAAAAADDAAEPDLDDDSDSAPFMIVVEHEAGRRGSEEASWRCSGSLVSLRTGVTSAECARGPGADATELWAVAAAAAAGLAARTDGARRVSRVATAGVHRDTSASSRGTSAAASTALLDLALLVLERPFGSAARAIPILMATAPQECSGGGVCHVVRALRGHGTSSSRSPRRTKLRIVDATLASDATCAARVRYWAALRDRALCLTGPELCQPEWGAGVVCGGKLCGVLSRSASGGADNAADVKHCGRTHAAHSLARWRRFLHCAHTLRACGRGDCAELCNERQLLDESGAVAESSEVAELATTIPVYSTDAETAAPPADRTRPPPPTAHRPPAAAHRPPAAAHAPPQMDLAHLAPSDHRQRAHDRTTASVIPPTRVRVSSGVLQRGGDVTILRGVTTVAATGAGGRGRQSPSPTRTPLPTDSQPPPTPASVRPTPLFEPNRPDFRAGEYGDNAAEYGGEEAAVPPVPVPLSTSTASTYGGPRPPRTSPSVTRSSIGIRPAPAPLSRRGGNAAITPPAVPRAGPKPRIATHKHSSPADRCFIHLPLLFICLGNSLTYLSVS